ncbi:transporter substrate-binding domain-containing protein [Turicimonas muris]|uniref:Cyclohexadienyl dehydratase n=1 Tax=Turicimonas muris TaxID=1796652 RepID=A0A227KEG6_9BURK|nr:transporter substrate-binding domain-containing protein [Turicimonas muris]ANU66381.2 cyclohexadienyl dehydratase [Burkholderiales bacterium YL45]OXE46023.1 cyclohexadienyl dehydratase [Turicimonas muris]QQQ97525.1 transporter substrate-binding domain-containing protein [Turicimonas muris]
MKKIIFPLALAAMAMAVSTVSMDASARSLAQIKESGVLKVGSTGDYKPMSYLNKETGKYEGFDAEMAESLAKYLGVKLEYVPTKWKTLQQDTMDDKFDVGISGITVTDARKKVMTMSDGYLTFGKTILVTKGKEGQFKSLADVNKPEVRVMYNPGGTNEKFAKESTPKAQLTMHEHNAEIPGLVGEGKADVMITETMEARRYVRDNPKLAAPLVDKPFTENHFGVLMKQGYPKLEEAVNDWMKKVKADGTMDKWENHYIK